MCVLCGPPPLVSFDYRKHKVVLFDEASVELVLRNRKLFQCPNAMVALGTSATNCHSYNVYVNNTMLVICSNGWQEQLRKSDWDGAQWILANQVYVAVTSPLWETNEDNFADKERSTP